MRPLLVWSHWMQRIILSKGVSLTVVCIIIMTGCQTQSPPARLTRVNTAHLDHLYTEVIQEEDTLGGIWIYCEAPDYHHVGDADEGFTCVDDVARALVFYSRHARHHDDPEIGRKIRHLSRFLLYMQSDHGYFYNFLLPDGTINTQHINSEAKPAFWSWRAFWALSEMSTLPGDDLKDLQAEARIAMDQLISKLDTLIPETVDTLMVNGITVPGYVYEMGPDQLSVLVTALVRYQEMYPSDHVRKLIRRFSNRILLHQFGTPDFFPFGAFLSWHEYWHAWGNAQSYALLIAGQLLEEKRFTDAALTEVRHFYPWVMQQGFLNEFKLVKTDSAFQHQDLKPFPQIAYGLRPMITASLEAYKLTGDIHYARQAADLCMWLFGKNAANLRMYDPSTGRTFDGISGPAEVNRNSGAESTIEALLSIQAMEDVTSADSLLALYLTSLQKE